MREILQSTAPDAVICMVPPALGFGIARAAVDAGVHFISTSYTGRLSELNDRAVEQGVTVPELGEFETYANGDALKYIPVYGLGASLKEMGRYALR